MTFHRRDVCRPESRRPDDPFAGLADESACEPRGIEPGAQSLERGSDVGNVRGAPVGHGPAAAHVDVGARAQHGASRLQQQGRESVDHFVGGASGVRFVQVQPIDREAGPRQGGG